MCNLRCRLRHRKKTLTFLGKKISNFYFSLSVDTFYRQRNTKRITDDQHSPSLVITTEILSMDASDHTKDLKFFLLLLRRTVIINTIYT